MLVFNSSGLPGPGGHLQLGRSELIFNAFLKSTCVWITKTLIFIEKILENIISLKVSEVHRNASEKR